MIIFIFIISGFTAELQWFHNDYFSNALCHPPIKQANITGSQCHLCIVKNIKFVN